MRWLWITLLIVLIVFGGGYFLLKTSSPARDFTLVPTNNLSPTMQLTSPHFSHNGRIPAKYTCDGDDISPALTIEDIPEEAQSFVLIVHDPDAPKDGGWTHWTVWNIDPATRSIEEGRAPEGAVEGVTDFEEKGYGGPCPPSGTHHYNFTLYAIDTTLNLASETSKDSLEAALEGHVLDRVILTGLYSREE